MDQETKKEFEDLTVVIKTSFEELEAKMAAKEDLESFRQEALETFAAKEDLESFRQEVKQDFKSLSDRFGERFLAIESELAGIRLELEKLSKRVKKDTDALASDVVKMRQKLNVLEKEVNMLKLQLGKA